MRQVFVCTKMPRNKEKKGRSKLIAQVVVIKVITGLSGRILDHMIVPCKAEGSMGENRKISRGN